VYPKFVLGGSCEGMTIMTMFIESCLEGVNRANLKFTNFRHNYKLGLVIVA
jgi:hypothetical protein